jgi:hypothetical protein
VDDLTPEQAIALIEVREVLRTCKIDVDVMSDEEIVSFVNRTIRWLADMVPTEDPVFSVIIKMANPNKDNQTE